MLLIAGNTMAQSVRERTNELGVLKTLGFRRARVMGLVLGEALLLTGLARHRLGLALVAIAVAGFAKAVEAFLPVFYVPPRSLVLGSARRRCSAWRAVGCPRSSRKRLSIVEALQESDDHALAGTDRGRHLPSICGASASASARRPSAVIGFAGVVAVFVAVLSIAEGFRRVMERAAIPDTAIVLRAGSDTEMTSGLSARPDAHHQGRAGRRRAPGGPVASAELFVVVNVPKRSTGTDANVPLRGVEPGGVRCARPRSRSSKGAAFQTGRNEVIVGRARRPGVRRPRRGQPPAVGREPWEVVGIFTAGGAVYESEIWTDARVLQPAYRRGTASSPSTPGSSRAAAFQRFKDALTADPRLEVNVFREDDYYPSSREVLRTLVTGCSATPSRS